MVAAIRSDCQRMTSAPDCSEPLSRTTPASHGLVLASRIGDRCADRVADDRHAAAVDSGREPKRSQRSGGVARSLPRTRS